MNKTFRHSGPPLKSNRSVIGCGGNVDRQFLLPHFSAGGPGVPDERWVEENTTIVTGATSEHSFNDNEDQPHFPPPPGSSLARAAWRRLSWLCWLCSAFLVSFLALVSAPLMVALPYAIERLGLVEESAGWNLDGCEIDCQGQLLNLSGKTALLFVALYVLFWRRSTADLPRLHLYRAAFAFFVFFLLFAFWLFYTARILLESSSRNVQLVPLISFAISLLDLLIFIHCVWIFFELRQIRPVFCIQVVRDPDGEWRSHEIGQMSIQEAAVQVLRLYRVHFPVYNAALENSRRSSGFSGRFRASAAGRTGFKLYDIDGHGEGVAALSEMNARILMQAASQRRMAAHNELFHEECDWERRFRKRKCRLVSCAEEIFAQVQATEHCPDKAAAIGNQVVESMDPQVAAKALLSSIAKQLNRFLRYTRQERFHTHNAVSTHIQRCLAFGFSARTFLQRFFSNSMPFQDELPESKWSIICGDSRASSLIRHGLTFVLRCHDQNSFDRGVQLLCTVSALPFLNLTEQPSPLNSFRLKILPGNRGTTAEMGV